MADDTMSLVSWLYDHAHVEREDYEGEQVHVEFEARPAIVEKARAKAADISVPADSA